MGNKKKGMAGLFILTAAVVSFFGCNKKNDNNPSVQITATTKDSAATLADAGEQLVNPYTFMLADKVFDMALANDPSNLKAQFYKSFLKRLMVFKGVLTRVRPITQTYGNIQQLDNSIKQLPEVALKDFLLAGSPDIKTVTDAQDLIRAYMQTLIDFRQFLVDNADAGLTINLNPYVFSDQIQQDWAKSCVVVTNTDESVQVVCNPNDIALRHVNSADLMLLRQYTAGELLYWTFYNSYSIEGIDKIVSRDGTPLTEEQTIARIKQQPQFGTLRSAHTFGLLKTFAIDFSAAAKWAIKMQNQLCPNGPDSSVTQRPGFLFKEGICVRSIDETTRALTTLDSAIQGTITVLGTNTAGNPQDVQINAFAWSSKAPPADLKKSILPTRVTTCGQPVQLLDPTIGGIFVNGDSSQFIQNSCN